MLLYLHISSRTPTTSILKKSVFEQLWNFANAVIDETTENVHTYEQLLKNPKTAETRKQGMCKELVRLAQCYKNLSHGTYTIFFIKNNEIKHIPKDLTVTYAHIITN